MAEEESTPSEEKNQFDFDRTTRNDRLSLWLHTALPSGLSFLLHFLCLSVDLIVTYQLIWNHQLLKTGLLVLVFIYIPVIFTIVLKLPDPPASIGLDAVALWFVKVSATIVFFPFTTLIKQFMRAAWSVAVIQAQKPSQEILHEYELLLSPQDHSYLFLQAFLHSAPQAVLQLHLLFLAIARNSFTEYLQCFSVLLSILTVAQTAALYHRYQAQVEGGRSPVLLLNPPQVNRAREPLLAVQLRLNTEIVRLETDSISSQVVNFSAWFLLIFGRITCAVLSFELHLFYTSIMLALHFILMLVYYYLSQPTSFIDIPSRVLNAFFSLVTLVEVSVTFYPVELLYIIFFVCIIAEDTCLSFFIFIYSDFKCFNGILNCNHFGMYTYLIINAHVLGVLIFGIYLARFRPKDKTVSSQ